MTSSKTGFTGNASVTNAGANNIVAGAGMTNKLDVAGATDTIVTGTNSKEIKVDGSTTRADNLSATVNAGDNTTKVDVGATNGFDTVVVNGGEKTKTVVVNDSADITVDAAAATSVTADGTTASDDKATVKLGVDATVVVGATEQIENVTIEVADGVTVALTGSDLNSVNKAKLAVKSDGAVTLQADATELAGVTVTNNADSLTVEVDHDAAADLSKVSANLITLTGSNNSALTFTTGANVLVADEDLIAAGASFVGKSATNGSLNLSVLADQAQAITATTLKTLNLNVELNEEDADDKATLAAVNNGTRDVVLTSADEVVITSLTAKNFDASESTGKLTATVETAAESVIGSQGKNDLTLNTVANEVSVVTFDGDDTVTLGAADATDNVTLVLGGGKNTVNAVTNGIAGADLSVVTGSGDDTVKVKADSTSGVNNIVLELGDGKNTVELTTANGANDNNITIVTGAGNDTLKMQSATLAKDTIDWTAGSGTNTLDLNGKDISLGDITVDGLTHILDASGTGVVSGSLLNGKDYTIQGDGSIATLLDVAITAAGEYDFSGLTLDGTLTKGIGGLDITGAGKDTIVATDGNDKITVGANDSTVTGGKGADEIDLNGKTGVTVIVAQGDSGKTATSHDLIDNYTANDVIFKLGIKGTSSNFAEVDADSNTGTDDLDTFAKAQTFANGNDGFKLDHKGKNFLFLYDSDGVAANTAGPNGWLVIDYDADGTADAFIQLTGTAVDTGDLAFGDIIA